MLNCVKMFILPSKHIFLITSKVLQTASILSRNYSTETNLKHILTKKIELRQEIVKKLRKDHGNEKVGEITLNMMYGGMRGMTALVCDTSLLDPEEGIRFRGFSIQELKTALPTAEKGGEPLPEGIFWLLITGDIPTARQVTAISHEWADRAHLPQHVETLLKNLPSNVHPMAQLSCAVTALSSESLFREAYSNGVRKADYWKTVLDDAMNLLAKLPIIAAFIYRHLYKNDTNIGVVEHNKCWSENFVHMLGYTDPKFVELMRLYLTIHSDHEGANVTAHTAHLVGSALSDPYLAMSAGLNGLAGPLHGLANQEVLIWLMKIQKQLGENITEDSVKDFVWKTLKSGQVIPGYGHAVLRKTDPRYLCQRDFAAKHLPDDKMFHLVSHVYKVTPPILMQIGKVQNPWPNVDAHSGVLLQHFGMKEMNYYTVLFGVSRAMGVLSQLVWARALGFPIERPKSLTTDVLLKKFGG